MEWIRGGPTSLNAQNITEALNGSLMRLQTDYIDILQLHWPDRSDVFTINSFFPVLESFQALHPVTFMFAWVVRRLALH